MTVTLAGGRRLGARVAAGADPAPAGGGHGVAVRGDGLCGLGSSARCGWSGGSPGCRTTPRTSSTCRRCHPERAVPSAREFYEEFVRARSTGTGRRGAASACLPRRPRLLARRSQLRHPRRQPLPRPTDHRRAVAPQKIEVRVPQRRDRRTPPARAPRRARRAAPACSPWCRSRAGRPRPGWRSAWAGRSCRARRRPARSSGISVGSVK